MIGEQTQQTREDIERVMDSLKDLLLEKNRRYGDAALNPPKVFSKNEAPDAIAVRLDDKIARVKNSPQPRRNDVADLMGYLALYAVSRGWTGFSDLID